MLHKPFLDAIGNPTGKYIIPMISSSYSLAACVTSVFVATFAFKIGRRGTIILGCVAAVIGSVIQSSAYSVAQLIVGRVCTVSSFVFLTALDARIIFQEFGKLNVNLRVLLSAAFQGSSSYRSRFIRLS